MAVKFVAEIDFKTALNAATKAADKTRETFNKAMEAGVSSGIFSGKARENLLKLDKFQRDLSHKQRELQRRENLRQMKADETLIDHRSDLELKAEALRKKAKEAAGKAGESSLLRQLRLTENLISETHEAEKNWSKFSKETDDIARGLAASSKAMDGIVSKVKRSSGYMEASKESAESIREAFSNINDLSKLGENIEGLAESVGDAFKEGIDVQSLARSLGQGAGKWITKGISAVGGGGAGMTAVAGAIGGAVAALGILIAAFIAVDKKVKEFNKNLVKTHGAFAITRLGGGDLNKGLKTLRHTMMDLSGNLGVTQEEAEQLFDSLDKGGLTLERLVRGTTNASDQQDRLSASLRGMYAAANAAGIGLSEYADNLTNYVNDLGMSVESVNEGFASIADMAARSAFGTRRFYSMVVQATSGQSALNVSLEQTGDLLMRMSKIMGAKKAAEMVGGAAGEFGNMSAQERMKNVLIAGAGGRKVFRREATEQARTFGRTTEGRGTEAAAAFSTALQRAGLTGRGLETALTNAQTDPQDFVKRLGALNPRDQRALIAELGTLPGMDEMARQLNSLVNVTRASSGGFDSMVNSVQELSAGGALAFKAAEVRRIMGDRSIEEMTAIQRTAIENITGMSGNALDSFASMVQRQTGVFEQLQRRGKRGFSDEAERNRFAEQFGVTLNEQGQVVTAAIHRNEQGVIDAVTPLGQVIQSGDEMLQVTAQQQTQQEKSPQEQALDAAQATMDATVSIADILENKVFQALQSIYDSISGPVLDILSHIPGLGDVGQRVQDQIALGKEIGNQIREIDRGASGRARQRASLQEDLKKAKTPEEKTAVRARIEAARADQERINQQRQNLVEARHRGTEADFSGSRIEETQFEAADIGDQVGEGLVDAVIGPLGQIIAEDQRAQRGENLSGRRTFRTREEAQAYAGRGGMVREVQVRRRLTPQEMASGLVQQAGAANAAANAAPAAAPVAPAGAAPPSQAEIAAMVANADRITASAITAQVLAQTPGGTGGAGPAVRVAPAAADAANRPAVDATESLQASTTQQNDKAKRLALKTAAQQHEDLQKMMEGRTLGDGLAQSKLPDAIAIADAKMRLLESLTTKQLGDKDLVNRLLGGTASPTEVADLTQAGPGGTGGAGIYGAIRHMARQAHDFVYQDRGGRSVITPIDREDQVTGGRPGGPIANAGGRPGGNVYITVNGGDQRQVFETVRRAIQQAGITPNRVPGGGG